MITPVRPELVLSACRAVQLVAVRLKVWVTVLAIHFLDRAFDQPYATKTEYAPTEGVTPLDECYVFAHRADTAATVAAIKRGLENDGLGDLARDIHLSDGGGAAAGAARPIERREGLRSLRIALPRVLAIEPDGASRDLDAETDLFPQIDWAAFDVAACAARLPKDARPPDSQFVRLRAGDHGVETDAAAVLASEAKFDVAYAVRSIADLVPNVFGAWAIVDGLLKELRALGWGDVLMDRPWLF